MMLNLSSLHFLRSCSIFILTREITTLQSLYLEFRKNFRLTYSRLELGQCSLV